MVFACMLQANVGAEDGVPLHILGLPVVEHLCPFVYPCMYSGQEGSIVHIRSMFANSMVILACSFWITFDSTCILSRRRKG